MFTSQQDEILSFVSKLTFLGSCGINANLNLNTLYGNLYINFNVDFGNMEQPIAPPHYVPTCRSKPIQTRRRRRRERQTKPFNRSQEVLNSYFESSEEAFVNGHEDEGRDIKMCRCPRTLF